MMKKGLILAICMTFGITLASNAMNHKISNDFVKTEITSVSPFCISIAKGDFEMVKKMIELGTEVNKVSKGMTPLMYAARYNRVDIIKLLVENGAKLNAKDKKGFNAIKYAEQAGAKEAKMLLTELKKK